MSKRRHSDDLTEEVSPQDAKAPRRIKPNDVWIPGGESKSIEYKFPLVGDDANLRLLEYAAKRTFERQQCDLQIVTQNIQLCEKEHYELLGYMVDERPLPTNQQMLRWLGELIMEENWKSLVLKVYNTLKEAWVQTIGEEAKRKEPRIINNEDFSSEIRETLREAIQKLRTEDTQKPNSVAELLNSARRAQAGSQAE